MPSKRVSIKRKTSTKKNMRGGWKYNKKTKSPKERIHQMSRKKGGSCGCNKTDRR